MNSYGLKPLNNQLTSVMHFPVYIPKLQRRDECNINGYGGQCGITRPDGLLGWIMMLAVITL